MARGSGAAQAAANQGNAASMFATNQAEAIAPQAQALYSTLAPELEAQAANPQGFSQQDRAAMNTSAQQSAGGAESAAVGQGALRAARTRNAGGGDAATADSVRSVGQNLSKAALGTQMANARLKEQQHESALGEMGGLYNTEAGLVPADLRAAGSDIGATAEAVNADTNARKQSWDWFNNVTGILGPAAKAYVGGGGG